MLKVFFGLLAVVALTVSHPHARNSHPPHLVHAHTGYAEQAHAHHAAHTSHIAHSSHVAHSSHHTHQVASDHHSRHTHHNDSMC